MHGETCTMDVHPRTATGEMGGGTLRSPSKSKVESRLVESSVKDAVDAGSPNAMSKLTMFISLLRSANYFLRLMSVVFMIVCENFECVIGEELALTALPILFMGLADFG